MYSNFCVEFIYSDFIYIKDYLENKSKNGLNDRGINDVWQRENNDVVLIRTNSVY